MLKIKNLPNQPYTNKSIVAVFFIGMYCVFSSLTANADILSMPENDKPEAVIDENPVLLPRRGITKSQVEAEYGTPSLKHPTIGDPPITRWDYDGFSVFFEYNHVLHSVIPEKPKPIYNKEELNTGY